MAASASDSYGVKIKINDVYNINEIDFPDNAFINAVVNPSSNYSYSDNVYDINYIDGWDSENGFDTPIIENTQIINDSDTGRKYLDIDLIRPLVRGEYIEIIDLPIVYEYGSEDEGILLKSFASIFVNKRYYKKNKSDLELKRLLDQLVLGS